MPKPATVSDPPMIDHHEAAELLGCTPRDVLNMAKRGDVPEFKLVHGRKRGRGTKASPRWVTDREAFHESFRQTRRAIKAGVLRNPPGQSPRERR